MEAAGVDLGFAEECDPYLLTNRYFPSKVGGKPAWLDLKNIPKPEDLQCRLCNEPMNFLCQVYAPTESDPDAFHRTIFLFICKSSACNKPNSAQNLKAFRSQLKRQNDFYSPIAPDEEEELPAIKCPSSLCKVCGCLGPMKCSLCKNAFYCSKSHQREDWRNGHKMICKENSQSTEPTTSTIPFPEFDIEIEPEPENAQTQSEDDEEAEARRQKEYEELVKEGKTGNLSEISETELAKYASADDGDKVFGQFKKRIAASPEQILRYHRNGEPLLITKPCTDDFLVAPDCENCGSKRIFEFQIMPQLLNYLKEEILDWGTIGVYTCSESCSTSSKYVEEHVIKQDIVSEPANEQSL